MNGWSWYWLCWAVTTFLIGFLPAEIYALASGHPENTLSAQIWRLEQVMPGQHVWQWTAAHVLIGGILIVLFGWLIGHFVFHLWT